MMLEYLEVGDIIEEFGHLRFVDKDFVAFPLSDNDDPDISLGGSHWESHLKIVLLFFEFSCFLPFGLYCVALLVLISYFVAIPAKSQHACLNYFVVLTRRCHICVGFRVSNTSRRLSSFIAATSLNFTIQWGVVPLGHYTRRRWLSPRSLRKHLGWMVVGLRRWLLQFAHSRRMATIVACEFEFRHITHRLPSCFSVWLATLSNHTFPARQRLPTVADWFRSCVVIVVFVTWLDL
jgi:hypothetical protein